MLHYLVELFQNMIYLRCSVNVLFRSPNEIVNPNLQISFFFFSLYQTALFFSPLHVNSLLRRAAVHFHTEISLIISE